MRGFCRILLVPWMGRVDSDVVDEAFAGGQEELVRTLGAFLAVPLLPGNGAGAAFFPLGGCH